VPESGPNELRDGGNVRQPEWLVIRAVAIALCLLFVNSTQAQQDYPARPIRIIYPFAAGSGNDGVARLVAQRLSTAWGQPVVVENRTGAGGTIAAEIVAKSPPDGYTLLVSTASLAVNATLFPKLPVRELVPVSQISSNSIAIAVHPSVPARTLKEFIEVAKSRKEGLNFGSNGVGTTTHLAGAWLQLASGLKFNHIPYKGAVPAVAALLSGEVDVAFPGPLTARELMRAKKIYAIAVTGLRRSELLPELPTLDSVYPGFNVDNWTAMWAPPGTSSAIVNKLQAEIAKSVQHPDIQNYLRRYDNPAVGSTPAEFAQFLGQEIDKYAKLIKLSDAKADP
jgi:tripartite-type tricarboxylate transporter receptor subunit TctC